jgi:lysyl-tRNA synthetase class 2
MVAAIRRFFDAEGFVEVETPVLQVSPGLEPHLKAFATRLEAPDGFMSGLYLHTSPEFAMKKLLVAGETRLFQIAAVFRNGERSATHHPEFRMLEWYRAHAGYEALMADCEGLLREVLSATGRPHFAWRGKTADPRLDFERLSVADAFRRFAGVDVFAGLRDARHPDARIFARAAADIGVRTAPDDGWDDIFSRVFLAKVEPRLGSPAPTILFDYPVHMAALSRPKPSDPRVAERFELYVAGLELANAFGELTDAAEQRRRFEADSALKARLYGARYPIDDDFMAALAYGLPECAGIALGVDRLAMLAAGVDRIDDVLWSPVCEVGS